MKKLFERSLNQIQRTTSGFIRNLESLISWDARLIGITGSRGCGKTTLILQHIKKVFSSPFSEVLYVSLDALWFSSGSLSDLVDHFVKIGGTHLFLDEVHSYPGWSKEVKNLYDSYPELHIIFTGSSLLELHRGTADLSRRALMYHLPGLSFREFLSLETGKDFPILSLDQVLDDHLVSAASILELVRPFRFFQDYLVYGYYPYYLEGKEDYPRRLEATISMILGQELPQLRGIDPSYIPKLKQLVAIIAQSVPFLPNISKLSERIGINRNTFLSYLHHLQDAEILRLLYRDTQGIGLLQKPEKLYLDNTNLMNLLHHTSPEIGNVRETFLANQLSQIDQITYPRQGDLCIRDTIIEIGGRNKKRKQIQGIPDAYIAADEIEYGHGKTIPLWLFGFLY